MTEIEFRRAFGPLLIRSLHDDVFGAKVRELAVLCAAENRIAGIAGEPITTERRAELLDRLNALLAEVGAPPVPP